LSLLRRQFVFLVGSAKGKFGGVSRSFLVRVTARGGGSLGEYLRGGRSTKNRRTKAEQISFGGTMGENCFLNFGYKKRAYVFALHKLSEVF